MKRDIKLTHERLCEVLSYDHLTGIFTWRIRAGKGHPGNAAGSPTNQDYLRIMIDGERFLAHRLAWFYHYCAWPEKQIDHISLDKSDNRITNLREATGSQNQSNKSLQKNNTSGFKGVDVLGNKFQARIKINRKPIYLGLFDTADEAHAAYVAAANDNFKEFARVA